MEGQGEGLEGAGADQAAAPSRTRRVDFIYDRSTALPSGNSKSTDRG